MNICSISVTLSLLCKYILNSCKLSLLGAVVASRLSEIENWNVLLLEAGGDETEISDVPLLAGYLQLSQLDWQYKTEPDGDACLGKYSSPFLILLLKFQAAHNTHIEKDVSNRTSGNNTITLNLKPCLLKFRYSQRLNRLETVLIQKR